jgi:CheY-like chemotaxis protein
MSNATPALFFAPDADVIVTELLLPGHMNGMALIERLKRDTQTKAVPIIVLTSAAWDSERQRAERAGCDLFLAKPCLPADLMRAIRGLLVSSRTQTKRPKPAKANLLNEPAMTRDQQRTG